MTTSLCLCIALTVFSALPVFGASEENADLLEDNIVTVNDEQISVPEDEDSCTDLSDPDASGIPDEPAEVLESESTAVYKSRADIIKELISDPLLYKPVGYKTHDCVLTSNVYMLRRACIYCGHADSCDSITNKTLRAKACTSKSGSSLKYSYTFKIDGITFEVVHGLLTGSKASKTKQLTKLLNSHPEGVVVRGRSTSGSGHGILVTECKNGTLYAVDSAQNLKGTKGIVKMKNTTVPNISSCSHIWYIENLSGAERYSD